MTLLPTVIGVLFGLVEDDDATLLHIVVPKMELVQRIFSDSALGDDTSTWNTAAATNKNSKLNSAMKRINGDLKGFYLLLEFVEVHCQDYDFDDVVLNWFVYL